MDTKKRKDLIVKIILSIIIILLIYKCYKVNKEKNNKVPKGNVNIIEISCIESDSCKVKNSRSQRTPNSINNNQEENIDPINENNDNPNLVDGENKEELLVIDDEIKWDNSTNVKIFSNSMYELGDKIAPESSNVYQFVIKNGLLQNLKYEVAFIENNAYNINMKYKLKKNDTYLIDHYVSASELNIYDMLLDSKTNDTYYLEWKWISNDNDTEIGSKLDSLYELKIEIKAESYNE